MAGIDALKNQIPSTQEIRERLTATTHERKFLRELLKLAEKRDATQAPNKARAPGRRGTVMSIGDATADPTRSQVRLTGEEES
jgi:hypothetical protein